MSAPRPPPLRAVPTYRACAPARSRPADFERFDLVIAMDRANVEALTRIASDKTHKIRRFLEFAPHIDVAEVPDPYYGGEEGFDHALDLIEAASAGLADYIANPSG